MECVIIFAWTDEGQRYDSEANLHMARVRGKRHISRYDFQSLSFQNLFHVRKEGGVLGEYLGSKFPG